MENQNDPQQPVNLQQNLSSKLIALLLANKSIIIITVILSIASFSTTGYLLMANKKPSLSVNPTQGNILLVPTSTSLPVETISNTPPLTTPTPTIFAVNPTATWSAYVSSKYSYSIKYPPNWTAQITPQSDPKILEYLVFNPIATKAGTLSITLSYGNRTYVQALALDPQTGKTILIASVSSKMKNSKDSNGYKATNVIVPYGLNTIIFNAKDAYINFFNQMLTTLKLSK